MRLRIVRPLPPELEGIDVSALRFNGSYEIAAPLSDLLIIAGYAVPIDGPLQPDAARAQRRPRSKRRPKAK